MLVFILVSGPRQGDKMVNTLVGLLLYQKPKTLIT